LGERKDHSPAKRKEGKKFHLTRGETRSEGWKGRAFYLDQGKKNWYGRGGKGAFPGEKKGIGP